MDWGKKVNMFKDEQKLLSASPLTQQQQVAVGGLHCWK